MDRLLAQTTPDPVAVAVNAVDAVVLGGEMPGVPDVVDREEAGERAGGDANAKADDDDGGRDGEECEAPLAETLAVEKHEGERDPAVGCG